MPKRAQAKKPKRIWRRIAVASGLFVAVAGGLAGWIGYRELTANLPPVDNLLRYQLPVATRVYADDGALLGEFFTEKRYLVPIARIPPTVRQAFIAAEDASFYSHKGVDLFGILRATAANLHAGEVVQGGSTITQQVVRAILLTPEKSYERKVKEIFLALRLERQLTKDEILYLYLNLIYLGNGAYGVGAAAKEYFGKEVQDLTLAEAALLAGLPQAPSRYSPIRHWKRAKYRQRYVLQQMAQERFIPWEEAERALNAPIELVRHNSQSPTYLAAPYFVEHVRRFLEDRYGGTAPYQLGLNVYTTVSLPMQQAAEAALRKGLEEVDHGRTQARPLRRLSRREAERFIETAQSTKDAAPPEPGRSYQALVLGQATDGGFKIQVNRFTGRLVATPEFPLPRGLAVNDVLAVRRAARDGENLEFNVDADPQLEGALVSIDLPTGHVKALVGGYDFNRSKFNRATQALRQPGSAFKPFIYAAALDRGYTPASVIIDEPIVLSGARQVWMPQNYDEKFKGPTTLREALTFSRNVVTVKVAQNVGLNYLVDYLPRFGFSRPFPKNLSLALGSAEVTLLELTRAYTVFANQGRLLDPVFISKITDAHGRTLDEFEPASRAVISPETAYLVTSMLKSVVQRGTGRRVRALGRPTAGKTGTTNDIHDAWFVGYTPELATGVWVGYDSERSLGKDQTGGRAAAPIFITYMRTALGNRPVSDFAIPEGITFVSVEPGTGRPASPDSAGAFLECFKEGTEPRRQLVRDESPFFEDELDRAVDRLRQRSQGLESDGDWHPAPDETGGEDEDGDWASDDPWRSDRAETIYDRRDRSRGRQLDERPAPRAEDYLGPAGEKYDRRYQRPRNDEAQAGEYRSNRPRRRGRIVEEPLAY